MDVGRAPGQKESPLAAAAARRFCSPAAGCQQSFDPAGPAPPSNEALRPLARQRSAATASPAEVASEPSGRPPSAAVFISTPRRLRACSLRPLAPGCTAGGADQQRRPRAAWHRPDVHARRRSTPGRGGRGGNRNWPDRPQQVGPCTTVAARRSTLEGVPCARGAQDGAREGREGGKMGRRRFCKARATEFPGTRERARVA